MQAQLEAERLEQRAQEERYENMAAEAEEKSRKLESAPGNPPSLAQIQPARLSS
eukprot:COSAG04_NODE_725_length_10792_cov_4.701206_3_plen_54_part_00